MLDCSKKSRMENDQGIRAGEVQYLYSRMNHVEAAESIDAKDLYGAPDPAMVFVENRLHSQTP